MDLLTQPAQTTSLALEGHLTRLNAAEIEADILAALAAEATATVQLDLGRVQFMDSAALAAIASGFSQARQRQRRLVLCKVPPTIRLMLEITGLDQLLEVIEPLELNG